MKLRGKIICVLILFGIVILIAFTYVIYPNISLGCEGDARLYHNHVLSQKTEEEYISYLGNDLNELPQRIFELWNNM